MTPEKIHLLLIDDDPALLAVLELGLRVDDQLDVTAVSTAASAISMLNERRFDLVITDYSLDDAQVNGMEIMRCARQRSNPPLVILITAFASMELTLDAIRLGAYDFLTKPFQLEELQLVVRNAVQKIILEHDSAVLRERNDQLQQTLESLEGNQQALTLRIEQLIEELQRNGVVEAHPALGHVVLSDTTRRRYQDQLGAYRKQSRSISAVARTALDGHELASIGENAFEPIDPSTPSVEA